MFLKECWNVDDCPVVFSYVARGSHIEVALRGFDDRKGVNF